MVGDIKHIVIIESLHDERLTGLEIYNDIIKFGVELSAKYFTHKYHSVNTKNELVELMKFYIENAIHINNGLLFHFEMHGEKNLRGLILANGELIEWKELNDLFRPINITLKDKLFITMATCFGRHLYKGIDPYEKSPYSGYISANTAVYPSEIVEKFTILFEQLLKSGNLVNAYFAMEKSESNFFYKDRKETFRDSFQSVFNKLKNDVDYKADFVKGVEDQAKAEGQELPSKAEMELIFQKALRDSYELRLKAFDF